MVVRRGSYIYSTIFFLPSILVTNAVLIYSIFKFDKKEAERIQKNKETHFIYPKSEEKVKNSIKIFLILSS